MLVPIVAPGIGGARAEHLHDFAPRMIPPNRAAQRDALLRRRSRHANLARTRRAATAIKPAVRTETQAVGKRVVHIRRASQAVEQNLGRAVRHIVTIAVGDEKHLRRTHHPHTPWPASMPVNTFSL